MRAVADIMPEAAEARAAEFGVGAQSVDDLLANDEIDVIVNLTIPEVHYASPRTSSSAGKHAYSEKPLVLTLEEGWTSKRPPRNRDCWSAARRTPSSAAPTSRRGR